MAENYKELYHWAKHMLDKYQDEIVPGLREQLAKRVEVVHCRECTWFKPYQKPVEDFDGRCVVHMCETDEEEYCSCGKRRDDGNNE